MEPVQPRITANVSESSSEVGFGWKKWLMILGIVLIGMIFWIWISSPMVVTVTGSGEVSVPATNATLSFTISATDSSIQNAVFSVSGKADSMRNYLKSKGVAEEDITQSQVTAVPAGLISPGANGFQATISMAAKTVHVNDVSSLVSDLYTNGALVVAQPVLSVENQDKLDHEAFNSALKDAKNQAWKIGLLNWKFIQKIISINQVSSPTTSTSTTRADTLTTSGNSLAAQNGVFKIVKAVAVSYKMW